ncbi:MAG: phosphate-starvation-inducible E [Alphaproteobacteria bacterium]|nr:phosphate-starvation-inducible E [Alphaproteobacteria bacterium]
MSHDPLRHDPNDASKAGTPDDSEGARARGLAPAAFLWIERGLLILIAFLTIAAAGLEVRRVVDEQSVDLADILLMFLYLEVMGMISVFYTRRGSLFVYPIFIAITALARLIVIQGKEMAPENILFEAGAILLLSAAAVIVTRTRSS